MTSKEIARAAIAFRNPPRIPVAIYNMELPDAPDLSDAPCLRKWQEHQLDDITTISFCAADGGPISKPVEGEPHTKFDEWGVKWIEGQAVDPPLDTWDKWESYPFPDPHAAGRFATVDEQIRINKDIYITGLIWNTTFERLWFLRGMENLLLDPYDNPRQFGQLCDKYLQFNLAVLDRWLHTDVDAIYYGDDLGTQTGLLMSPETWRRYYRPMVRELFGRTRSAGKDVFFHSCGNITSILGDLIDCGMNVVNPLQPHAMDVGGVVKEFGKDLVIWGGTDLQHLIANGTPEQIEREIEQVADLCWRGGGYIGGTAQGCPPGTPIANMEAFYRAFSRLGSP